MNTTRPWPSRMFGSTAWVTPIWAVTLTSSCLDRSSRDNPSTGPFTMMPALFTTPFSAAGSRSARPAMARRSVMSSGIACTFGRRSRLSSASADRAAAYTSHPRPLMRLVMARPIPRPAPVISTEGDIGFSFGSGSWGGGGGQCSSGDQGQLGHGCNVGLLDLDQPDCGDHHDDSQDGGD